MNKVTAIGTTHKLVSATRMLVRILLPCMLLSMAGAALAAALNQDLQGIADKVANNTPWTQARSGEKISQPSHPLDIQTLSIEKQESKNTPANALLRVYQFHYVLQQARLIVVNPDNQQVVKTQPIISVHLPLNNNEINYASQLLSAQTAIMELLRNEQIKRGRQPFEQLSELDVKASIYEPLDHDDNCHRQRCALLSLFDATRTVFATEPVVNLQSLNVRLLNTQ